MPPDDTTTTLAGRAVKASIVKESSASNSCRRVQRTRRSCGRELCLRALSPSEAKPSAQCCGPMSVFQHPLDTSGRHHLLVHQLHAAQQSARSLMLSCLQLTLVQRALLARRALTVLLIAAASHLALDGLPCMARLHACLQVTPVGLATSKPCPSHVVCR